VGGLFGIGNLKNEDSNSLKKRKVIEKREDANGIGKRRFERKFGETKFAHGIGENGDANRKLKKRRLPIVS
jgi:hypothetical protein